MEAKDIKKVACVGAGVIGYSWALYYALKKLVVNVYDLTDEKLDLAKKRIHESLLNLMQNGVVSKEEITEIEGRISYTTSMEEAVKDVQFITESGPESYEIKQKMTEEMESIHLVRPLLHLQHLDYLSVRLRKMQNIPRDL